MQVILLEDIRGVGKKDEVINVKPRLCKKLSF